MPEVIFTGRPSAWWPRLLWRRTGRGMAAIETRHKPESNYQSVEASERAQATARRGYGKSPTGPYLRS